VTDGAAATGPATPWLSVLVPVYNVADYLTECIDSVLQQADMQVELLALDDCSTDDSLLCLKALAERWGGRLRVLEHSRNGGLSAARNTLIDAARGTYLWFLDSDDKLLPGAIPALKQIVQRDAPEVVLCDFSVWRERTRLKHRLRGELHRRTFAGPAHRLMHDPCALMAGMLWTGELHAWSKISKRALWTEELRFPPGRYFEDMEPMLQLALKAKSFYYAPQPWVAYRQRGNSILSTMTLQKCRDQSSALVGFAEALAKSTSGCLDSPPLRLGLAHQSARNLGGAMRYLQSLRHQPTAPTPAVLAALAEEVRQDFCKVSPLSPQQLERAYLWRGWWLRRARFHRMFETWRT
jgi:hypothetical protein